MQNYDYKKGLPPLLLCLAIWGFQPLYWNICPPISTLLLMNFRILWAGIFCVILVRATGKWNQLKEVFTTREILIREIPAAFFLAVDWFVFLFAVQSGKVQETSLGYYILPLVEFLSGIIFFHEKLRWQHLIMLGLIILGIVLSVDSFGEFPYVSIILSVAFAIYAAIKKSLHVDSVVSTTAEILIMVPFSIVYLIFFGDLSSVLPSFSFADHLLIIGSGLVTAVPMLLYAIALQNLPLTTIGFFQYLAPTLSLICSILLGESFNFAKLNSFICIWLGVALFIIYTIRHPQQE